jgi:hypothetical protein
MLYALQVLKMDTKGEGRLDSSSIFRGNEASKEISDDTRSGGR